MKIIKKRENLLDIMEEITDPTLRKLAEKMLKESDKLIADFADDKRKIDWFESEEDLQLFVARNITKE